MSSQPTPIDQYQKQPFHAATLDGHTIEHDVYTRGEGAPVVLIQELPGIGMETLALADEFVARGFKIILPHLFGPIGKTAMGANLARVFCMRKEFKLFAANKSSPIVDWLKALCRKAKEESPGSGVGVIGMCLTGNFALSLMADDSVLAAVCSQPAMPLGKQKALDINPEDVNIIAKRIDETAPVKAYRFANDKACAPPKFEAIDKTFNTDGKTRVELNTLPGDGHSVLTLDFVDEAGHPTRQALDEILGYFETQLAS